MLQGARRGSPWLDDLVAGESAGRVAGSEEKPDGLPDGGTQLAQVDVEGVTPEEACERRGVEIVRIPLKYCSDNAAMIAAAAYFHRGRATLTRWKTLRAKGNLKIS